LIILKAKSGPSWLRKKYSEQIKNKTITENELKKCAKRIAKNLTSTDIHPIHSKNIDMDECEKMGLQILKLDKDSDYWKNIFELYLRADIFMRNLSNKNKGMISKIFMSKKEHLFTYHKKLN